jgi:hypothetical protein
MNIPFIPSPPVIERQETVFQIPDSLPSSLSSLSSLSLSLPTCLQRRSQSVPMTPDNSPNIVDDQLPETRPVLLRQNAIYREDKK